jgi:processive 1,2-diacylglycerol beta-glucosyltransferase
VTIITKVPTTCPIKVGLLTRCGLNSDVMVLSAASGDGHVRAADAMVSALRAHDIAARHEEVLQYMSPLLRRLYAEHYVETVNRRPRLLGFAYEAMDRAGRFERSRLWFDLLQSRRLVRLLAEADPGIVLCTHFLPAEIALHARRKGMLDSRIGVILTDFDFHPLWLYSGVDWYFVAGEDARARLIALGVAADTIRMTGIPIDCAFATCEAKLAARARMGLQPDLATLLVAAGGFGMGPVEAILAALQRLRRPVQIVVVCGRNQELQRHLAALAPQAHPLTVLGYTGEMHAWMAAADLLVGKAGGLTCAEAMAGGLVPVIVNAIPGPEERNAAILVRLGAAIWCRSTGTLAGDVDGLLGDPPRLRAMQRAVAGIAAPTAADDIASIVAGAAASPPLPSPPAA